jgi:pimeloyl-ACP methyl ester carboxylesterase
MRHIHVRLGPLAVTEAGDEGPLVVLVPGFTGSKEDFRLVLDPLAAAGYRVVAIDQRGQYQSPGPDEPTAYTVDALASDLLELLDVLGEPVHLVGHSFGGLVARAAVLRAPAAVRSLTLLSSGPAALTGPRVDALDFMRPLLEGGGLVAVADAVQALEDAMGDTRPPELRAFLRERFLANSPVGLLTMAQALTSEPDRVQELAATGVPVLVTYGEGDDAWHPELQADMAQRLAAQHVVIADALHSAAVENPDATAAALTSFFREVDSASAA